MYTFLILYTRKWRFFPYFLRYLYVYIFDDIGHRSGPSGRIRYGCGYGSACSGTQCQVHTYINLCVYIYVCAYICVYTYWYMYLYIYDMVVLAPGHSARYVKYIWILIYIIISIIIIFRRVLYERIINPHSPSPPPL